MTALNGAKSAPPPIYSEGRGLPSISSTFASAAAMAPASEALLGMTIGNRLFVGQITTLHARCSSVGSRMSSSHVRYLMFFAATCRSPSHGSVTIAEAGAWANPGWSEAGLITAYRRGGAS